MKFFAPMPDKEKELWKSINWKILLLNRFSRLGILIFSAISLYLSSNNLMLNIIIMILLLFVSIFIFTDDKATIENEVLQGRKKRKLTK